MELRQLGALESLDLSNNQLQGKKKHRKLIRDIDHFEVQALLSTAGILFCTN